MANTPRTRRPSKATAAKAASNGASSSAELDLDTIEREDPDAGPFAFTHQGRRYLMSDPREVDWQELIQAMSDPVLFFKLTLPADDVYDFLATPLPTWKMNVLMERYQRHYGLTGQGDRSALPR